MVQCKRLSRSATLKHLSGVNTLDGRFLQNSGPKFALPIQGGPLFWREQLLSDSWYAGVT